MADGVLEKTMRVYFRGAAFTNRWLFIPALYSKEENSIKFENIAPFLALVRVYR